ncbi:MAG: signal recognition particle protein [Gammaproteobacteria bacterium]|nr:signal recognition particle protein [Gammaproteobacteria bacterium]
MFGNLSERLGEALRSVRGKGRISEENIKEAVRQVRMALLEADVALPVVKEFIAGVRDKASGEIVTRSLTPDQAFVKIVKDELVAIMGAHNEELSLRTQPPAVVLLAGLQGAGKTTTAAKLAARLLQRNDSKVMLASADVYRPAAIAQLGKLADQVGAEFFPSDAGDKPAVIASAALAAARLAQVDVLILDTAGRLHVDNEMMAEIAELHAQVQPVETLFVVDSMTGQDAVRAAQAFSEALPLTGVILTKADGDARGGAALSVRQITGAPIKFIGTGEKIDALEAFHPERVASRILGMGDVLSLVEEVEQKVDQDKARKLAKKLGKGKDFDLEDLREQFSQMLDMGGLAQILEKLPGGLSQKAAAVPDEKQIRHQIALINAMTPRERRFPRIIDGSRKRRISGGAGRPPQELSRLLKQHRQMQKMMKKMKGGGMARMMRAMKGGLPPGPGR